MRLNITIARIGVAIASVLSVAASGAAGPPLEPPAPGTPPWTLTSVSLELTVDYGRPSVMGTTTLTVMNDGGRTETEVPFLLNRLMSIRAVTDQHARPLKWQSSVSVFEDDPFRQVVAARVTLSTPLAPGQTATIRVQHDGPLVGYTETGSLYIKDRVDTAFTILRSDAVAFPVLGVASQRANRAMRRNDFRFDARVTVPEAEIVATGGRFLGRTVAGRTATFHFAGDKVPFVNIAIAPYQLTEADGIRVYALPADAVRAESVLTATRRAIARLQEIYGPLPVPPTATVIEIPDGFGSQASATAGIILDAQAFRDKAALPQLYHELSHFWNPNDLDVPSPRWNEGLATYLQYRLARELDGFDGTPDAVERARTRVCSAETRIRLERTPFLRFGAESATDFSYRVGFLMFTALETLIGADRLDAAIREYVQARMEKGGTTAELISVTSRASQKLDAFFRDWMETSGWVSPVCTAPTFADAITHWK